MPKVTSRPSAAQAAARATARANTPASPMTWSEGSTSRSTSSPSGAAPPTAFREANADRAATAIAGAVLRPSGSNSTRPVGSRPCSCIWAAARKRCSLLQITKGGVSSGRPPSRFRVSPNSVWPPRSMNCLGYRRRESGQSRVPVPPHKITGQSFIMPPPTGRKCASRPEPERKESARPGRNAGKILP